jgi:hypothetical protein
MAGGPEKKILESAWTQGLHPVYLIPGKAPEIFHLSGSPARPNTALKQANRLQAGLLTPGLT